MQAQDINFPNGLSLADTNLINIFSEFDKGVLITDRFGTVIFYNTAMSHIDDLDPAWVIGKNVTEIYDLTDETSMIMRCLRNQAPMKNIYLFYRTRLGKIANTIHTIFPLFHQQKLIGAICFVHDYAMYESMMSNGPKPHIKKQPLGDGTRYRFSNIIGANADFLRALNTARMASDSPSPVLIYGETGTGKELLAQSIHNHSFRNKNPFIAINCAAIPENLLEGILFGTVKGAFTGAMDKHGLFERANGGTLFLDEVNSMPIGLQVKLLRALQEKKIRRVGSLTEISIDLKIISSVNQEPHQAIRIGTLRSDLFYRIGVVFISVPPLRERPDDIEALTNHFLKKFNRLIGKSVLRVSPQVNEMFHRYRWPGNVRELEHLIEGAMNLVLAANDIRPEHLPMHFIKACTLQPDHQPVENIFMDQSLGLTYDPIAAPMPPDQSGPDQSAINKLDQLPESQFAFERKMIKRAMHHARGNVAQAARSIGISRQLLNYKLKKHGLRRDRFVS